MKMKSKRITSIVLSVMLVSALLIPASANTSGTTPVTMTAAAAAFNVTIPTVLPVTVDNQGAVTVANNVAITNDSCGPINIANVAVSALSSWATVDYDSANMTGEKVNTKKIALTINGGKTTGADIFSGATFPVIVGRGGTGAIVYNAKLPAQATALNAASLVNVMFTVAWDKAVSSAGATYGAVPANVTDYYTFTDDTALTGGYRVGLNANFKTALQANSGAGASYMDWTPGSPLPNPGSMYNGTPVTSMGYLFQNCNGLKSLVLSSFDTKNVKNMTSMFDCCISLTSLNVSGFNTAKVTNMSNMFNMCFSIVSLDLSSFDTTITTNMGNMFNSCSSVTAAYAKTSADATKLNAAAGTYATFTFVVK